MYRWTSANQNRIFSIVHMLYFWAIIIFETLASPEQKGQFPRQNGWEMKVEAAWVELRLSWNNPRTTEDHGVWCWNLLDLESKWREMWLIQGTCFINIQLSVFVSGIKVKLLRFIVYFSDSPQCNKILIFISPLKYVNRQVNQMGKYLSIIPAFGKWRQKVQDLKVIFRYISNLRPAWAIWDLITNTYTHTQAHWYKHSARCGSPSL